MKENSDFRLERERYDERAKFLISQGNTELIEQDWKEQNLLFEFADKKLGELFKVNSRLLEIGAGTGDHTESILKVTTKKVTVIDVSELSLQVNKTRFGNGVNCVVASMVNMPFKNDSFDGVISFGSLAYGDPEKTDSEILRVLKKGGSVFFVDTLNNFSIYKIKRFFNYILGRRTYSVFSRIPKIERINALIEKFESYEISYFGAIYWLYSPLSLLIGDNLTLKFISKYDRKLSNRFTCLKFVLVCKSFKDNK